jgi:peptidoglycan hydrolase-like protein with peptidoglycan-binding domain
MPCSSATCRTASPAPAASTLPWGEVRQLSARGIEEVQTRLQTEGYAVSKIDGKAGMNTRALVGAYQKANGLKVDCWPSEALLVHMRKAAGKSVALPPAK